MSFLTRIDEQIEDQYHELSGQASGEALKVLLESWHSAKFAADDAKSMIDDIDSTIGHLIDFRTRLSKSVETGQPMQNSQHCAAETTELLSSSWYGGEELDVNVAFYNEHSQKFIGEYESVTFESVHGHWWGKLVDSGFATRPLRILDVGAGAGRDSAFFINAGHDVLAIEPADKMREHINARYPEIRVIGKPIPMNQTLLGDPFDLILLSAVWMHIRPDLRKQAFDDLATHLTKGGKMVVFLRHGPFNDGRQEHPVSMEELKGYAAANDLSLATSNEGQTDVLGRSDVYWEIAILSRPSI